MCIGVGDTIDSIIGIGHSIDGIIDIGPTISPFLEITAVLTKRLIIILTPSSSSKIEVSSFCLLVSSTSEMSPVSFLSKTGTHLLWGCMRPKQGNCTVISGRKG